MKMEELQHESESINQATDKRVLLARLEKNRKQELETMIMCQEKEEQHISGGAKLLLSQLRMDSAKHACI